MSHEAKRLERHLYRHVRETSARYSLFSPGDKVLVAVSGGKDS